MNLIIHFQKKCLLMQKLNEEREEIDFLRNIKRAVREAAKSSFLNGSAIKAIKAFNPHPPPPSLMAIETFFLSFSFFVFK